MPLHRTRGEAAGKWGLIGEAVGAVAINDVDGFKGEDLLGLAPYLHENA
jgi:hypothetical protein